MKNKIRLFFMDVDGTLTDGKIYMGVNGELLKAFDTKDGYGINNILPKHNIVPIIITARGSKILVNRCKELNIKYVYQNCNNKKDRMLKVASDFSIELNEQGILPGVAYIGDDIIDIPCMKIAEFKGCPFDAVFKVKEISNFISTKTGGNGAVRDFIEWLLDNVNSNIK